MKFCEERHFLTKVVYNPAKDDTLAGL